MIKVTDRFYINATTHNKNLKLVRNKIIRRNTYDER
jgi:hypothetical protein